MKIHSTTTAVVTGGASGLGLATARALREAGAKVADVGCGLGASTILMATVLMHSGRLAEAIDLLGSAVASIPMPPYGFVDHATQFALAVAYDRDEQITLAHETLATMRAGNPEAFSAVLTEFEGRGHPIAFVPPYVRVTRASIERAISMSKDMTFNNRVLWTDVERELC